MACGQRCFNSATASQLWKQSNRHIALDRWEGFNSATASQLWKRAESQQSERTGTASIRPQLLSCGNQFPDGTAFDVTTLQFGHSFSAVETTGNGQLFSPGIFELQFGHSFSAVETSPQDFIRERNKNPLQFGHSFSAVETSLN